MEIKNIAFNLAFAFLSLVIIILFYKNTFLTTALLLILAVIGLAKWRSKLSAAIFLFMIFFGGFIDIIGADFGVWSYAVSDFFDVPCWLFIGWGIVAVFIYQMAVEFKKLGIEDKK